MSINNVTQEASELVELNSDDLDVVVGGQGNQNLHGKKTESRTLKFHELDNYTKQTNNGYEVGTRDISFDALETITYV